MTDDILLQVHKPARYIGREWNVSKKDFMKADIKFALCFPDLYEVGMSNLGIRIIYGILNATPDVCCERFFSPAADMENVLRGRNEEITSLESKRRLGEFDIIGFSLAHELNYTNVLNMLELGNIPLKASSRDLTYPLVIGGGPCVLNPEPMHAFFDLFLVGEAEEAIVEIMEVYRRFKASLKDNDLGKEELLLKLSAIGGVYVPSFYEVAYDAEGRIEEFKPRIKGVPERIKKRFIQDLDASFFPEAWLLPYIETIHDRITLEIMRGCPNQCRFCQGRYQYFPFRQKRVETVLNLASRIYKNTGYEDISLIGLSVSDHANIEELVTKLVGAFKEKAISISLPSIKPQDCMGNLSSLIATVKKTGLTFAPEAASERLRSIIGKYFDLENFYQSLTQAFQHGYQRVKLYFMVGLPTEEDQDLDAIVTFVTDISQLGRKVAKRAAQVNISINTLIPKPHTPFQWFKMLDLENIKYKQDYIKRKMAGRRFKLNFHDPYMSILEGVLSRGDRRLAEVILAAFRNGARFDAWENNFSFQKWEDAFISCGIEMNSYLRERSIKEILPWGFLDIGVSSQVVEAEYAKMHKLIDIT